MVGTIDDFRAKLIGGGARPNQFRVEINNPPAGGVAFPCLLYTSPSPRD